MSNKTCRHTLARTQRLTEILLVGAGEGGGGYGRGGGGVRTGVGGGGGEIVDSLLPD